FLMTAPRRRMAAGSPGGRRLIAEFGKGVVDRRPRALGGIPTAPKGTAEPIAEFSAVLPRIKPAHSDQPAVKRDRKYRLAAGFIDRGEECHSVRGAIGMRDTRGVLGDAAVAGQSHHGRYVAVRRRTQRKPRGFERGDATRL